MRLKYLLLSFPFLLMSYVDGISQVPSPNCVYYGGYPWRQGGCLTSQDLNAAIDSARLLPDTLPFSAISNLPSTLAGHGITNGLRKDLNLSDVTSPTQALATLEPSAVVMTTGTIAVSSVDVIWKPSTDANTTFLLPATGAAVVNQRHRFINGSLGTFLMQVSANSAQTIIMPNGTGTFFSLPKPGDKVEMRYVGSGQWMAE